MRLSEPGVVVVSFMRLLLMGCGGLMRRFVVLGLMSAMALGGCNTGPATQDQMMSMQSTCQSYGFKQGSEAFASCLLNLDQTRIADARERRRRMGDALAEAGRDMGRQEQQRQARQINCTSMRTGNMTNTSCY